MDKLAFQLIPEKQLGFGYKKKIEGRGCLKQDNRVDKDIQAGNFRRLQRIFQIVYKTETMKRMK